MCLSDLAANSVREVVELGEFILSRMLSANFWLSVLQWHRVVKVFKRKTIDDFFFQTSLKKNHTFSIANSWEGQQRINLRERLRMLFVKTGLLQ